MAARSILHHLRCASQRGPATAVYMTARGKKRGIHPRLFENVVITTNGASMFFESVLPSTEPVRLTEDLFNSAPWVPKDQIVRSKHKKVIAFESQYETNDSIPEEFK